MMTSATPVPYLGSRISVISKADIRYEGILYTVDTKDSTIALAKVRSFGTEGRPVEQPIAARDEVYEYIIFKAQDIKDLVVCETPQPAPLLCGAVTYDPAIVQLSQSSNRFNNTVGTDFIGLQPPIIPIVTSQSAMTLPPSSTFSNHETQTRPNSPLIDKAVQAPASGFRGRGRGYNVEGGRIRGGYGRGAPRRERTASSGGSGSDQQHVAGVAQCDAENNNKIAISHGAQASRGSRSASSTFGRARGNAPSVGRGGREPPGSGRGGFSRVPPENPSAYLPAHQQREYSSSAARQTHPPTRQSSDAMQRGGFSRASGPIPNFQTPQQQLHQQYCINLPGFQRGSTPYRRMQRGLLRGGLGRAIYPKQGVYFSQPPPPPGFPGRGFFLPRAMMRSPFQRGMGFPRGGYGMRGNRSGYFIPRSGDGMPQRDNAHTLQFESDYDFEQANASFAQTMDDVKDQVSKLTITVDPPSPIEQNVPHSSLPSQANEEGGSHGGDASESNVECYYDKNQSFFDRISCESLEKHDGYKRQLPPPRHQRELNQETFGTVFYGGFRRNDYNRGRFIHYGRFRQRERGFVSRENLIRVH